jgi:hypothetical protein
VQTLTIRLRPRHREWLDQQAAAASRSTIIRQLIEQAITTQQQAPTNAR